MDIRYCARSNMGVPSGERYELCRSVHAEMNAIIHASRRDAIGATMYLIGVEIQDGRPLQAGAEPCRLCKRVIINAGLDKVTTRNGNGDVITHHVKDWITYEDMNYGLETLESGRQAGDYRQEEL